MTRKEVVTELCSLCSEVGERVFFSSDEHDCFCGHNGITEDNFRFSPQVMNFVRDAIRRAISEKVNPE